MRLGLGLGVTAGVGGGGGFDPATLALTGWWRAYAGSAPWVGRASGGTSGSHDLINAGSDPSSGSALGGQPTADFNGSANTLTTAAAVTAYASTTASTVIVLFNADTAAAPSGNIYDDPAFLRDANADYGLTFTSSGVTAFAYQSGYKSKTIATATGGWRLAIMRHNGTLLGLQIDSGSQQTVACGTLTVLTGVLDIAFGYGGGFYDGRIAELMTSDTCLTDPNVADLKTYFNARYGTTFT